MFSLLPLWECSEVSESEAFIFDFSRIKLTEKKQIPMLSYAILAFLLVVAMIISTKCFKSPHHHQQRQQQQLLPQYQDSVPSDLPSTMPLPSWALEAATQIQQQSYALPGPIPMKGEIIWFGEGKRHTRVYGSTE